MSRDGTAQPMVVVRHLGLRIGEIWGDESPSEARVDVLRHRASTEPIQGARCARFTTLLIDLLLEQDELFSAMEKETRYEIRRARDRDGLEVGSFDDPTEAILDRFGRDYDRFAREKGLPAMNRALLWGYRDARRLRLTRVDKGDLALVWHAYLCGDGWVRLLHSVSQLPRAVDPADRYLLGRANRYLHWDDIQHAKDSGARAYDLGGYYLGNSDEQKVQINRFKRGFGGTIVTTWDCLIPYSIRGRIYLTLRNRVRRPHEVLQKAERGR